MDIDNANAVFTEVWERVVKSGEDKSSIPVQKQPVQPVRSERTEKAVLEDFINSEARNTQCYAKLYRRLGQSREAQLAQNLSRKKNGILKKLQTSYFLLYGDTVKITPLPEEQNTSVLEILRSQYWLEREGTTAYAYSIKDGCHEKLKSLYEEIIRENTVAAEVIESLIESLME